MFEFVAAAVILTGAIILFKKPKGGGPDMPAIPDNVTHSDGWSSRHGYIHNSYHDRDLGAKLPSYSSNTLSGRNLDTT